MNIDNFKCWLISQGCEILPNTNPYEVLRFKGQQTAVFYTSGKCNSPYASKAYDCFSKGHKWDGAPISTGRYNTYVKQKRKLLLRDGCNCFFCGEYLGEDITVEHLISLSAGGKNELGNMVLAHAECNHNAGNLTVVEKVGIALKNRR